MTDFDLDLAMNPPGDDVQRVEDGLALFTQNLLGRDAGRQAFSVFLRSADGAVAGGANARLLYGDLHVDTLWCAEAVRGQGWGARILDRAEAAGRDRGAGSSLLNTLDPRMVAFYKKRGYDVIGEVPGLFAGETVVFLRKPL